jgi:hypothetical protein
MVGSMGPSSAPRDDFVGRLFAALERDGECIDMRFGEVAGDDVRWHLRSHARYDGIGGLAHTIRSTGARVLGDLPQLSGLSRPPWSPDVAPRLALAWKGPSARWNALPASGAPQLVVRGRRFAHAWTVLGEERVSELTVAAKASGASVGGFLLSCLNTSLAPLVSHEDGPALWVVPVNMRTGGTQRLSNHLSFVPVRLGPDDGPRRVTRGARARLADGSHWILQSAAVALASLDQAGPAVTSLADRFRGRSIGLFSNLGAWHVVGPPGGSRAWVAAPPVNRFLPFGAAVVTVNGRLGLMLQAYPSLTLSDDEVAGWLDGWLDQIVRRISSGSAPILLPSARSTRWT